MQQTWYKGLKHGESGRGGGGEEGRPVVVQGGLKHGYGGSRVGLKRGNGGLRVGLKCVYGGPRGYEMWARRSKWV